MDRAPVLNRSENYGWSDEVFKSELVENVVNRISGEHFVGSVLLIRQNLCYDNKNSVYRCDLGLFSDPKTNE